MPNRIGIIERGVPQAYVRARASSATLCSVHVLRVFFSVFSIWKGESDTYQNGLGCISDTYPNPYPPVTVPPLFRGDFWEGDATKNPSVKKNGVFSEKGGGNSVNRGFGKDFYRKGNSQWRGSRHSLNRRTLKIEKLLSSSPSRKSALTRVAAINPPFDDTDPIRKFGIDSGSHTDWQNPAEFSPKGKPIRNFSIDPTSSIRTSIADAIFADAISETLTYDYSKDWQCKNLMYSKNGVVYKLPAGWFINRTPGKFINSGLFIKFKGLLCGNPIERWKSLILNFWPRGGL